MKLKNEYIKSIEGVTRTYKDVFYQVKMLTELQNNNEISVELFKKRINNLITLKLRK
jgi:hypothetical protein